MSILEAIIIAIVEGLTEFLPVSSTGHMIIAQSMMGVESTEFVKAFTVIIQFGAILSVVVLYWKKFFKLNKIKIFDKDSVVGLNTSQKYWTYLKRFLHKFDFYWKLFIALLPAAVLGLLFSDIIDDLLENVFVVSVMLIIGGVVMLFVDKWFNKPINDQSISWQRSLKIGLIQCIAMIPGVSRSFATIVGGMSTKLNRKNAAEFSFFLAVPTMAAAAGYKMFKLMKDPASMAMLKEHAITLAVGNVVAFLVAIIAIRFFIDFLTKHGFKAFGWYRIIVGLILIVLMLSGTGLNVI
ncbi:MAG: undecaprenyl-diphosphate phosphatase [Proteiniphilum sp.]|nr:undecaprenyl-diphosphate phosphatase [Proteiniphilum sp.]